MSEEALVDVDDPGDLAVKEAREMASVALSFLVNVMMNKAENTADRIQAARHILEVSGCLSL